MSKSAFFHACKRGDHWDAKREIKNGLDVNVVDDKKLTGLMYAAWNNNAITTMTLLQFDDIDVNYREPNYGISALHLAAADGCDSVISILSSRADVNIKRFNGVTPLMQAARYGCHKSVKELLEHKCILVNERDEEGETALHRMVRKEKEGARPSLSWMTPDYSLTSKYILECNSIDVNVVNAAGETPLYIAFREGSYDMVNNLLNHKNIIVDNKTYNLAKQKNNIYSAKIINMHLPTNTQSNIIPETKQVVSSSRPKRKAAIVAREKIKACL
jgi:ankyrin repeat protein